MGEIFIFLFVFYSSSSIGRSDKCPRKYCSVQAYCTSLAFEVPAYTTRNTHTDYVTDLYQGKWELWA